MHIYIDIHICTYMVGVATYVGLTLYPSHTREHNVKDKLLRTAANWNPTRTRCSAHSVVGGYSLAVDHRAGVGKAV